MKAAQPCLSTLLGKQRVFRGRLLCGWSPLVPSTGQTQSYTSRHVQIAGFLMETWSYGNALWVSMATISACVKTSGSLSCGARAYMHLMLAKNEDKRRRGQKRMRWLGEVS